MPMNRVIQQRRKQLGLTQEQVADSIGVTASAVNKWEKGNTCPDVALLAPLARLLQIDLNTLFGFYEDVTQEDLISICRAVSQTAQAEGFKAGFSLALEKLRIYPNSERLLHTMAMQLHGLLAAAGLDEEEAEEYMQRIDAWYERLTQSNDPAIRNSVNFMLASRAIHAEQYEAAQAYLDRMPNRSDTPDKRMLQAELYRKQGQAEDAARLMQAVLLSTVGDVQMVLYKLADVELEAGDADAAAYVSRRASLLVEAFDLNPYNTAVLPFQTAVANQDADQAVALLKKMFAALSSQWRAQDSPLYGRLAASSEGRSMESMIIPLLKEIERAPEYAFLRDKESFQALCGEYSPRE